MTKSDSAECCPKITMSIPKRDIDDPFLMIYCAKNFIASHTVRTYVDTGSGAKVAILHCWYFTVYGTVPGVTLEVLVDSSKNKKTRFI